MATAGEWTVMPLAFFGLGVFELLVLGGLAAGIVVVAIVVLVVTKKK